MPASRTNYSAPRNTRSTSATESQMVPMRDGPAARCRGPVAYSWDRRASRSAFVRRVLLDWRTGTHEIPVAERALDTPNGRPELPLARPWHREGRLFARVGPRPIG